MSVFDIAGLFFLFLLFVVWAPHALVVVRQQQEAVVETFGRYTRTLTPGLHFLFWPFQYLRATVSRQQQQFSQRIEVKTEDNVFVQLPVHVQYLVTNSAKSYYQLHDPVEQLGAYVLNAVRTKASGLPMARLFEAQDDISHTVADVLKERMETFGYQIRAVLVDQPEPAEPVKKAYDSVMASQRAREAAMNLAEATRIKIVAEANADREAKKLSGQGIAEMRTAVVEGLIANIDALKSKGLDQSEVVGVLTETLRLDALRDIGRHGNLIIASISDMTAGGDSGVPQPSAISAVSAALRAGAASAAAVKKPDEDAPG